MMTSDQFPFPVMTGVMWGGSDYTADQTTACGPGTRYPCGMTLQQMAQLYWRAKSYKLTASATASNYGVSDFGTAYADVNWPELDTPTDDLEYYQMGSGSGDTIQSYPAAQPDNEVPWVLVLPVYQVNTGDAVAEFPITPEEGTESFEEAMTESASAWTLRLFEFGALVTPETGLYWPSMELTLLPPGGGPLCGAISLQSDREALP